MSRAVWALSWPSATVLLLQTISNNIDRYFVSHLGGDQVAGLGISQTFGMLLFATVVAISTATTALVARSTGAGNDADAEEAARQSLYLGTVAAIIIMALLFPLGRYVFQMMAGDAVGIVEPATTYFQISILGFPFLFGMTIMIAAFRGTGDMLTPLKLTLTAALVTVLLDWLLINGNLGFPALGLRGAAIASVIARVASLVLGLALLWGSSLGGVLQHLRGIDFSWLARILRLGYPAGLQALLRSGAGLVYFTFLGRLEDGEAAIAALTIGLGIEGIAFMPGFAYATAAAAMVGQNLGALRPDRARESAYTCARQCMILMTIMACVFVIFAEPITRLFTTDPDITRLTVAYLRINAISEPFIALSMTMAGALQGAGDTRSPTVSTLLTLWLLRIPLTWALAIHLDLGTIAAWWVMAGTMMLNGIILWLVFRTERWRDIEI